MDLAGAVSEPTSGVHLPTTNPFYTQCFITCTNIWERKREISCMKPRRGYKQVNIGQPVLPTKPRTPHTAAELQGRQGSSAGWQWPCFSPNENGKSGNSGKAQKKTGKAAEQQLQLLESDPKLWQVTPACFHQLQRCCLQGEEDPAPKHQGRTRRARAAQVICPFLTSASSNSMKANPRCFSGEREASGHGQQRHTGPTVTQQPSGPVLSRPSTPPGENLPGELAPHRGDASTAAPGPSPPPTPVPSPSPGPTHPSRSPAGSGCR